MSIQLEKNIGKRYAESPIVQLIPLSESTVCMLNQDGKIYLKKEDNTYSIFYEVDDDAITAFDLVQSGKNNFDIMVVGTENGQLDFLNKTGNVQKRVKNAHKGSIISVQFSYDGQTIVSSDEDCVIKLWSRSGMLRSELGKAESPVYSMAWSLDNQVIALGSSKIITFKTVKPGMKDTVVQGADTGAVILLKWSMQDNLILSAGEDCRYMVWDNLYRQLYKSPSFTYPFTSGFWTNFSSHIILGNSFEIILAEKSGKLLYKFQPERMSFCLASSPSTNHVFCGLNSGHLQRGYVNLLHSVDYKNFVFELKTENSVSVTDIQSDYKEIMDYQNNQVLNLRAFNDNLLVLTTGQAYVYRTDNFITPVIFDNAKDPFLFSQLSSQSVLVAYRAAQPFGHIYDFKGKLICNFKLPTQLINRKLISLSYESICMVDPANSKIVQFLDSKTGKPMSQYIHPNEITETYLNHVADENQRKLLIIDSNKDVYIYHVAKNATKRVASLALSCSWHETFDIFAYTTFDKLHIIYSPNCLFIDQDLIKHLSISQQIGVKNEIINFHDNIVLLQNTNNVKTTNAVNPLVAKLLNTLNKKDNTLEQRVNTAVKMARYLKDKAVWAVLAAFCIENRDTRNSEIALSELESIEKVQLVSAINTIENSDVSQAKLLQLLNKNAEAEKLLVNAKLYYEAVKIHIDNFDFVNALKVAQTTAKKSPEFAWLQDYVLVYRERYFKDVGLTNQISDEFKGLKTQKTFEEIKELKKKFK